MKLYLASASSRRRQLLKKIGVRFRVLSPSYKERNTREKNPAKLVKKHALGKALSVLRRVQNGRILSADSVVYCRRQILGKPKNKKDAVSMMNTVQGKWQTVYTGVAILDVQKGHVVKEKIFVEKTHLLLKKFNRDEVLNYVRKTSPYDKAGGFEVQSEKYPLVEKIKGSYSNVVGLPIEKLRFLLKR